MNIIETKNLCYDYEEEVALNNINMSFEKGKTTAILGGNGAGKSTLFLNLNGVLKPSSGTVFFNGEPVEYSKKGIVDIRRKIGIVFQDPEDQLFSSSVKRDIAFGAIKMGLSEEEVSLRVNKAIEDTGISHIADKPTHALSYGQKKRVAIAGILAMKPEVMILDEPTAGLDPKGVSEILSLLEEIKNNKEITLIIATHEMDIVPIYCDNAYILNKGNVVYEGSVKELFKKPKLLRDNYLRLPRIAHLMEVLHNKDGINVDIGAATISEARKTIKEVINKRSWFFFGVDEYIFKNGKNLRYGYTTGSCAAAAAKAATIMLLTGSKITNISLMTPKGIMLNLNVYDIVLGETASCAIEKDSGDDPDITNGIKVYATAAKSSEEGIHIDGGIGIGRVTKKGLEQRIGEAAINKVPRSMIENEVKSVLEDLDYSGGINVEISIPDGVEIAKKTFNGRLGIEGGISILGTSGIVEPMSEKALTDSIKLEMKMLRENGHEYILVSPGNYGEAFTKETLNIDIKDSVKCSNYIGETLDYAVEFKVKGILLIGHIGKMVKLAGGIMNTHSKYADGRMEIIASHAAALGANRGIIEKILGSTTTDEAIEYLDEAGVREGVMKRISEKIHYHVSHRVYNEVKVGVIVFSNEYGLLCETSYARDLIKHFKEKSIWKKENFME